MTRWVAAAKPAAMSAGAERRVIPVILSGGAGTRLWPLSRRARPKQMLDLAGQGPMLAQTAARVTDESLFAPAMVVAGKDQASATRHHVMVAQPGATTQSTGLPDNPKQGGAWIMNAGTSTAHLMVPGQ